MKKILIVFGTRPEAIKMCPVIKKICECEEYQVTVCSSGQHSEMLDEVLACFDVSVDYNLKVMKPEQTLSAITSRILDGIEKLMEKETYDLVLVHGDTTTAYAAALAAFYHSIPIGHVEAGLRTYNLKSPFPEEFNRCSIDMMSSLLFAPTDIAKENLLKEGVDASKIYVTGNTVIDALKTTIRNDYYHKELEACEGNRIILLTAHRRENIGEPMKRIFKAIVRICDKFNDVRVIYPVHLNPQVIEIAQSILGECEHVHLINPLNTVDFHNFMNNSYLIVTDSGGVQEEAPSLNKPVLVVRDTTERPEGVSAGALKVIGTDEEAVFANISLLLNDTELYTRMSDAQNPYGDGIAAERIANSLADTLNGPK